VLRALDELPTGFSASAREIARRAGVSHPTASRVLASLESEGLVVARRSAHADTFELERDNVLVERISNLLTWERHLLDDLVSLLSRHLAKYGGLISDAFLFGSVARQDASPTSDIDIAVVCARESFEVVAEAMDRIAEEVRRRFGSDLRALIGTGPLEELQSGRRPGYRLWREVTGEGIPLVSAGEEGADA
jgi:predicted nucleotidyltransferase